MVNRVYNIFKDLWEKKEAIEKSTLIFNYDKNYYKISHIRLFWFIIPLELFIIN
jgi:hypothetical protein